jgi:hypothetical protein
VTHRRTQPPARHGRAAHCPARQPAAGSTHPVHCKRQSRTSNRSPRSGQLAARAGSWSGDQRHEDGLIPGAHVRCPRLDYESHATGLDRNEPGALLVAAGLGIPAEHALISLLALNGLQVSEATGASIEALGVATFGDYRSA